MTARDLQLCLRQRLSSGRKQQQERRDPALSQVETEVLRRLAAGQEMADIAIQLSVSEAAIKRHIKSVLFKARAKMKADRAGELSVL